MACTLVFSGSALYAEWITAAGTTVLSGKQRTVTMSPTVTNYDSSAGADQYVVRLPGIKDNAANIAMLAASDTYIAVEDAVVEGTSGTLIIGPRGTASGERKYTWLAISMGANMTWPYNNVVEMSIDYEGCGVLVRGTY